MQLSSRSFGRKTPLDFGARSLAFCFQLLDFSLERLFVADAPVQALPTKDAPLAFGAVQPTARLRRVGKFQPLRNAPRCCGREYLVARRNRVRLHVVHDDPHALGFREAFVNEPLQLARQVRHRPLLAYFDIPEATLRLTEHEPVAHASSRICVSEPLDLSRPPRQRATSLSNQLLARLVKADHRPLLVVSLSVPIQHLFQAGDELGMDLADPPLLLQPGRQFVCLRTWPTVSRQLAAAHFNSTTLSANKRRVERAGPSGGVRHAPATRCASCWPVSLRSAPRRGRSLRQPRLSSTNRLGVRSTVANPVLSEATLCSSVESSAASRSRRARVTWRAEWLERLTSWCNCSRSSVVKSTRYFFLGRCGSPPFGGLNQTIPVQRANPQN